MQYKYRWLYALMLGVVVTAIAYFYDIQPKLMQLAALRETENDLLKQLANIKQADKQNDTTIDAKLLVKHDKQSDLLSDLFAQLHMSGLVLQSIKLAQTTTANEILAHLDVQGDFQQLIMFVFALPHPPIILDFIYHSTEKNQYLFSMDVLLLMKDVLAHDYRDPSPMHNPFCLNNTNLVIPHDLANTQSISIDFIKMIGFLRQAKRIQAILLLPNGMLLAAEPGLILGKEHGLITEIHPNRVVITLPNHQQKERKLDF